MNSEGVARPFLAFSPCCTLVSFILPFRYAISCVFPVILSSDYLSFTVRALGTDPCSNYPQSPEYTFPHSPQDPWNLVTRGWICGLTSSSGCRCLLNSPAVHANVYSFYCVLLNSFKTKESESCHTMYATYSKISCLKLLRLIKWIVLWQTYLKRFCYCIFGEIKSVA